MDAKKCFKCGIEWPLIYFYKHSEMKDGHLNKCKKCTKKDVRKHREDNIEKIREYDRERSRLPHRVAQRVECNKIYRLSNPEKYKAHQKVQRALKKGDLKKQNCCVCGDEKSQAHHEDYLRPLDVIWLCSLHHHSIHEV